jgi:hypothetical protein
LEVLMGDKVFKKILVVGCSEKSYQDAVETAIRKAADTLSGLAWFEVREMRGAVKDDKVLEWQATVELAFKVE